MRIEFCSNVAKLHWQSTQIMIIFHICALNLYRIYKTKKAWLMRTDICW